MLGSILRKLSGGISNINLIVLFILSIIFIGAAMAPFYWNGNEINYFDLAYRSVDPEAFSQKHSVFDASQGRFVSFFLIGHAISAFGFETAKTILGISLWALYGVALAYLARALRLNAAGLAIGLVLFMQSGQWLVGGEWIFGTIEAKLFAYVMVFAGIALALSERWSLAMFSVAAATYFHFLVGGFWGGALLFLHVLWLARPAATAKLFGLFSILILPLVLILARERVGVDVDLTGLDRTVNEIYADLRSPHHVAPFAKGFREFVSQWGPGLFIHLGFAVVLLTSRLPDEGLPRQASRWLGWLNLYVVLAAGVAFLDRNTHVLAQFYLFRPASLIFLLSCLVLARIALHSIKAADLDGISIAAVIIALSIVLPDFAKNSALMVFRSPDNRLEASLSPAERDVVRWLAENTERTSAILLEPRDLDPPNISEGAAPLSGFERLTGRPFIVNFKFVPTAKQDVVEWYRRIQARKAFFEGDCTQLEAMGAEIVIFILEARLQMVEGCVTEAHRNNRFIVTRVN